MCVVFCPGGAKNDTQGIEPDRQAKVLCISIFALCERKNRNTDTMESTRAIPAGERRLFAPTLFPFQQKQWMAGRRALKLIKGRFGCDAKVAAEGVAILDFFAQHQGRLASGQLDCVDRFRTPPTREDSL